MGQNWFHTSLRALPFARENFPRQSQRSTKNQLHNNLGNNLTFLCFFFFFLNVINFRQIQTKNLWESSLNLISFCSLSENFFFFLRCSQPLKKQVQLPQSHWSTPAHPTLEVGAGRTDQGFSGSARCI